MISVSKRFSTDSVCPEITLFLSCWHASKRSLFNWEELEIVLEEAFGCGSYRVEVLQLFMRRLQSDNTISKLELKDLGQLIYYERPTKGIQHYDTLLQGA